MKRFVGAAVVVGLLGAGTALAGEKGGSGSHVERSQEKLPDGYRTSVTTPPGQQPEVKVTVDQKGWKQWGAQRQQEISRMRAENQQLKAQIAELEGKQSLEGVADVKQDERGIILTLTGGVLFEFNSEELMDTAKSKLDRVAEVLKQAPDAKFTVEGHTDSIGSEEYNKELSERRAQSVKDYLVEQGIAEANIDTVGKGESNAVTSNDSPEGRANNRRVEVVIPDGALGIGGAGAAGSEEQKPAEQQPSQQEPVQEQPAEEQLQ